MKRLLLAFSACLVVMVTMSEAMTAADINFLKFVGQESLDNIKAQVKKDDTQPKTREAEYRKNLLESAISNPDPKVLEFFLKLGLYPSSGMGNPLMPIFTHARVNLVAKMKLLVAAGANVNEPGTFNVTPIAFAARCTNAEAPEVLEFLLDAGANPHVRVPGMHQIIDFARENKQLQGTKALARLEKILAK